MKNYSVLFYCLCIFSFFSCRKDPAIYEINNLSGNKISLMGHAGMGIGFKYPTNSYESIEPCLKIGADGVEMDVQVTKDSVLLVYHDKYLQEGTLCNGMINDKLWSEIWGCHRASPLSSKIRMWTFLDLMEKLRSDGYNIYDLIFTLDCKLYTSSQDNKKYINQFANALFKTIEQLDFFENILIESQDTSFLRILQQKDRRLKLFFYPSTFDEGLEVTNQMNLFGISLHSDYVSREQVILAHNNSRRITLWGINSEKGNTDAISKSPDYIQSDKPIHLLKIFGKYKRPKER